METRTNGKSVWFLQYKLRIGVHIPKALYEDIKMNQWELYKMNRLLLRTPNEMIFFSFIYIVSLKTGSMWETICDTKAS